MDPDSAAVGERIRAAREARGLSQTELGSLIGVKQQSIAKIEGGGGTALPRLAAIAEALGSTTDALLGRGPADTLDLNSRYARISPKAQKRINDIIDAEERRMKDR